MTVCTNYIWEEFSTPLKDFIKKRIPKEQDADDILQEVFIKIHNNVESLMDDNKIDGWIYRITRNVIIDYYRKNNKPIKLIDFPEELKKETNEELPSNREIANCLMAMIADLPDKYKEAIILTEFQNLTQKELSQKMGLSLSGAKSRVQRARAKLKEMLLECCQLEFDRCGNVIDYQHKNNKCKYC